MKKKNINKTFLDYTSMHLKIASNFIFKFMSKVEDFTYKLTQITVADGGELFFPKMVQFHEGQPTAIGVFRLAFSNSIQG